MLNRTLVILGAIALLSTVNACSDNNSSKSKPDAKRTTDSGNIPNDLGNSSVDGLQNKGDINGDLKAADGGTTKYSGLITLAQLVGPPLDKDSTSSLNLALSASFENPNFSSKIKPDFVSTNYPNPGSCIAYKWTKDSAMNRTSGDAGKVTIKGFKEVDYIDGDNPTEAPKKLTSSIDCTRKQIGTTELYYYDCGLPSFPILLDSIISDTTSMDFTVAGGKDVSAFSETGVKPAPMVQAKSSFDLNAINPTNVKVEWETTQAALLVFVMTAYLQDGSEFAQIECSMLASGGSFTVPSEALALIPTPKDKNNLNMWAGLWSMNPKGSQTTWGDYMVGVGQGVYGLTCRNTTGFCTQE